MMGAYILIAMFVAAISVSGQEFKCPSENGYYPDPYQCDLYYKCNKGIAEEKLCPDGLVFVEENSSKEKCELPSNVDCGDRKELQEPQPSPGCQRANGYFKHPDPTACDKFYYCADGKVHELPCPPGLIFDEEQATCDWATHTKRTCGGPVKKDILDDGFSCPDGEIMGWNGRALPHPTFPHPEDCQKFYICRNGVQPQKGSCPSGQVYNENTFMCDEPANVEGCENFYDGKIIEKTKVPKKA